MADFSELVDLAAERLGGSVLWASDEFFASKDNLLKAEEAIFVEGKYTDRGKWMDGWESRRKREYALSTRAYPNCDSAIIRLGMPGIVREFVVDTAFFKGNYPKSCAIDGASLPGQPGLDVLLSSDLEWTPILDRVDLSGDSKNRFKVKSDQRFTHLRFHIHPDGGVARLRVHGDVVPDARWLGQAARPQLVDLAAAEHGGLVTSCNDMFFGSRHNLIMPGRGVNMGDGWETKRSRRPGPDWVVVRLGARGSIERAVVDTLHFKGNAPDACALSVATSESDPDGADDGAWRPLLDKFALQPHTRHVWDDLDAGEATHVRLRIWPDGGISRLRLYGVGSAMGREAFGMRYLRAMPPPELQAALTACCGSSAWVARMQLTRPFESLASMKERAAAIWRSLDAAAYDEAFRAHPRIGEQVAKTAQSHTARVWSAREQGAAMTADPAVLSALRDVNRAYEETFGRIYIVCAVGKSAEELLALAKVRLTNDATTELACAAVEQQKITELRLVKMVLQ